MQPKPELPPTLADDVAAVERISIVPALLKLLCQNTGMGFAAVARVTDDSWTACAVQDSIAFGLRPGDQLEVRSTLCFEARAAREPVAIDQASADPVYRDHHTPRIFGIESYISVPIVLSNGDYFGNLCAVDPGARTVSDPGTVGMFTAYAELIASQLEADAREAAAREVRLDERATADLREQFIAILGHDLRNPLAAISSLGDLLTRRGAKADVENVGRRILASTVRMARLVDDLLDFARTRLGAGLELSVAPVADLGAALLDVVQELRLAHPGHLIQDDIRLTGATVLCHRGRIQQLLSNLLGNAVNHGDPGLPVRVAAALEGQDVVVKVSNGGEPIPPALQRKIFEPYWRLPTHRPGGGLGLGLYICSRIMAAHGGSLQVSSTPDGTCFTARWPAAGVANLPGPVPS